MTDPTDPEQGGGAPGDDVADLVFALAATRELFAAAACSCAVVTADGLLQYIAADGAGADRIVGVTMPPTRGIAGWAVTSGQAIAVRDVTADARFARDVAESTNYVPATVLAAPVVSPAGDVLGVLQVLDPQASRRAGDSEGALDLLGTLAAHLAVLLPRLVAPADDPLMPLLSQVRATGGEELAHSILLALATHLGRSRG